MTNSERAAVLKRAVTVLKKIFTATQPDMTRTPMEQLIYSICLENASFQVADDVYSALTHNFFDWNEVRVSSSRELGETMKNLPEPQQTGLRLKRTLHYVFDQKYTFEIDEIKRMGIKAYNTYMTKMEYVTPFNASYLMMTVLGRHSIPVSSGEFEVLDILGLLDAKDRENNTASWLERVIEKKKANEFFSLLHQLAALYVKNPFGRKVQDILLSIVPDCKDRMPKRRKDESETDGTKAKPENNSSKSTQDVTPAPKADSGKQATSSKKTEVKKGGKPSEEKTVEPKKVEPKKVEPKKVEPKKAEPKKPEPKKVEPKKAEPKKVEPKKVEPKKAEPKKAEPKKVEPKKPVEKPAVKPTVKKAPATKTPSSPVNKTKTDSKTDKPVQKKSTGKSAAKTVESKSDKSPARKKPK